MGGVGGNGRRRALLGVELIVDGSRYDNIELAKIARAHADNEWRTGGTYTADGFVEGHIRDDKEIPVKVDKEILAELSAKRIPCTAFEHAGLAKAQPVMDDESGFPLNEMRSMAWHDIDLVERLFKSHTFDWIRLARIWREIEQLALMGDNVDQMIERVNAMLSFWNASEPVEI